MGKKTLAEVEALAHKIVKSYFCDSDMEFLISTFADDIIWIGGGKEQKAEGKSAVTACFLKGKDEMIACNMSEEVYHTLELGGGCYLCEGVSMLQSRPETGTYLNMQQRVTFIFREKGNTLETVHIHNSVPFAEMKDDELFPVESGRAEFQRLRAALNLKNQEYEQQAMFLEQLYNTVPCGIIQFSTDYKHEVIAINPMVWKFYGYKSEEEYRSEIQSPLQAVKAQDYDWILSVINELQLNGEPASYHRCCKTKTSDEAWINVVMGRIVNSEGKEVIQAVFTDITEQMRLEKAQEQERILENRYLRMAIYTAYPLIMSLNLTKDTYSCFVDEQSTQFFQKEGSFTELVQKKIPEVSHSYQEDFAKTFNRENLLRRFASGEQEVYMELQEKGLDGQYHWIAIHIIRVDNPFNDDILAINLIKMLDVQRAEQARQEQLLMDALVSARAASNAKTDFLSRMSHDIRTPMNAIIGMSTIGQLKLENQKVVEDCFKKIDAASKFLLTLINDILDMSKIETDKMVIAHELFDFKGFAEEVNQIIYPQTAEKEVSYEMRAMEPLESYYIGDSLRMKQILLNLLSNALKFTPSGGKIGIDIQEGNRTNGYVYLQFVVWDTGVGMSSAFMERIFMPFEQEEPSNARNNIGSGLGLSIVYNLVQLMGGNIQVDSRKNEGSKFTVSIPFQLVSDDEEQEWERKRQNLLKGFKVLVADDDPIIGNQTAFILEDIGAKTVWAESGLQAIKEVEKGIQENCMFDVAMIDWKMPGIDGIETARRIRHLVGDDTMIIMITAYDWSNIEREAREAGIDFFIAKPLLRSVIYDAFLQIDTKETVEKMNINNMFEGKRILLVEDNALNQEIAKTLLEMNGARIDVAQNGKEAVECFAQQEIGTYQAILMDIRMPVMDGIEATRTIRAMQREDAVHIPILAMTANAFEEDKQAAYDADMTGYLVKPLDMKVLLAELEKYCINNKEKAVGKHCEN